MRLGDLSREPDDPQDVIERTCAVALWDAGFAVHEYARGLEVIDVNDTGETYDLRVRWVNNAAG